MDQLREYLPPALRPFADYAPAVGRFIFFRMVSPVMDQFQRLGYQLSHLSQASISDLQMQDVAGPVVTLLLLYLALMSLWRTTRFALSFGVWAAKWGTIVALCAVAWAWWTGAWDGRGGIDYGHAARNFMGLMNGPPQYQNHRHGARGARGDDWGSWVTGALGDDWGNWVTDKAWEVAGNVKGEWFAQVLGQDAPQGSAWEAMLNWGANAVKGKGKGTSDKADRKAGSSKVR